MIQSNLVRSTSCKPAIHSHARVMRFMPCQRASLHCREQQLVGHDEGVPFPRWYSVSPIQSGEGGGRSAHVRRSVTGKTTTGELRSALQQLLRPREAAEKFRCAAPSIRLWKRSLGTLLKDGCLSPFLGSKHSTSQRVKRLKSSAAFKTQEHVNKCLMRCQECEDLQEGKNVISSKRVV